MRYVYKNENDDFYNFRWYESPTVWLCVSPVVGAMAVIYEISRKTSIFFLNLVILVSFLIFIVLAVYEFLEVKKYLKSFKHFISYLVNYNDVQRFNTALLNSKTASSMVNHKYRILPQTWEYYENGNYYFQVEKLDGWLSSDLDKIAEILSEAVGDRFEVTSKSEKNGSWFCYILSPVVQNLRFIPKKLQDLYIEPYSVKLMNNLTIDMNKNPHLGVFGLTGSAKSTVLWTIVFEKIASMRSIGASLLFFLDGKGEFASLTGIPTDHFSKDSETTIQVLNQIINIMNDRKPRIQKAVHERGFAGLTACDLNLKPVFLFVDEFASILANFQTSKEKKQLISLMLQVLQQGRSLGVFVIFASQSPATEVIPQQLRMQLGTVILLGTANADIQRMAFDEVATTGTVPKFAGYYIQKTADMPTPQFFETPDVFKHGLNNLKIYEKILKKEVIK